MLREFKIDNVVVNDESNCYVIAEVGNNHQGDLEKAKQIIRAAHECGVNAVKLQTRHNRSLYTKTMYDQSYDNPNSFADTYGVHRDCLELKREDYIALIQFAKNLKITLFSTPFDFKSADLLEELDMPAYKIASGDLASIPLIKYVASFKKPMIISTGGAALEDVRRAYEVIMPINSQLCIMQCTASYPCEFSDLNLRVIETYRQAFPDVVIGLSAHDSGIAMGPVAYLLGARVIEKHFTLNRAWKGTDHAFSLEPSGMKKIVRDLQRTRIALGNGIKAPLECEKNPIRKMAKKLVAARNLAAGHVLTAADIAIKSPGDGMKAYEFEKLVGKKLSRSLIEDEDFNWKDLVNVESVAL